MTVLTAVGPASALGRPQDRWARPETRQAPAKPRENSLTGVLREIWRGQQAEAAAKLDRKAKAREAAAQEPPGTAATKAPKTSEKTLAKSAGKPEASPKGAQAEHTKPEPASSKSVRVASAAAAPAPARKDVSRASGSAKGSPQPAAVVAKAGSRTVQSKAASSSSDKDAAAPVRVAAKAGAAASQTPAPKRERTDNPPMARRRSPGKVKNTLRVLTGKSLIIDLAKDAKRV
ncbi:MAG: hypothetical protein D6760_04995, partial [Deltaproteobacteria bacterium]